MAWGCRKNPLPGRRDRFASRRRRLHSKTAIADAIAKAEPSVVAIHRYKADNSQAPETQAVRGRNAA